MQRWLRIAHGIDRFTEHLGRLMYWLTLGMVLLGAYNALARYTDRFTGWSLSANTWLELQWYLFALVFLLGAAYGLKHDAHVRVDVIYTRLSARGKAWVNLLGTLLFLLPFCLVMIWTSWGFVRNAWAVWEQSPDPGGLPRYPIKSVIPLAFVLLIAQGGALAIKQIAVLRGYETEDNLSEDERTAPPA